MYNNLKCSRKKTFISYLLFYFGCCSGFATVYLTMLTNRCSKIKTAREQGKKTEAIYHMLTNEERVIVIILYACRFYVSFLNFIRVFDFCTEL